MINTNSKPPLPVQGVLQSHPRTPCQEYSPHAGTAGKGFVVSFHVQGSFKGSCQSSIKGSFEKNII